MKKVLSLVLVLVMAAALMACPVFAANGDGSGGGNGQSPLNVESVTFRGTDLAEAEVMSDGEIVVVFDRGMDKYSDATKGSIFIENVVAAVKFDGDRSFTVSFKGVPAGEYTLVISADAKANNGNTLGKDYKVKFTVIGSGSDFGERCPSEDFTDVNRSTDCWYHNAVDWAVTQEITNGTSKTTFSPAKACTRAEAVTFLYRAAGEPKVDGLKNPFTDVKKDSYYYNAVLWAVNQNITKGISATTFEPDTTCNRAHIATFLFRAKNAQPLENAKNPFKDVPAGTWYTDAVLWAADQGITNGDGAADTFNPNGDCTRAQIVTFLYRAMV